MSNHEPQNDAAGGQSALTDGLGGDEPKIKLVTHSCGCEYVGKDGTMRRMGTQRYEDGTISFHIATYWDGDDKEPVTTSVRMGVEAYSVLLEMLNVFAVDRERFRNTDYTPPNDRGNRER